MTGFRLALGGAAAFYKCRPDLVCYGKAMSNGRGISAIVGREEIMSLLESEVFYSNTYNGDPYNCAFVLATLEILRQNEQEIYSHIWSMGRKLILGADALGIPIVGTGVRSIFNLPEKKRVALCQNLVKAGILMDRPNYPSLAHTDKSLKQTLDAMERLLNDDASLRPA